MLGEVGVDVQSLLALEPAEFVAKLSEATPQELAQLARRVCAYFSSLPRSPVEAGGIPGTVR